MEDNIEQSSGGNEGREALTMRLGDPGMTALHKVGLAGLYMTLRAFDTDPSLAAARKRLASAGCSWKYDATSVTLGWSERPYVSFAAFFCDVFRIDNSGLIWFPGLGEPIQNAPHAAVMQEAILDTFLQHGDSAIKLEFEAHSTGSVDNPSFDKYRALKWYYLQGPKPAEKKKSTESAIEMLFDEEEKWKHEIQIKSFHLPGGGQRHERLPRTALTETRERTLCLLFAPTACFYFKVVRVGGQFPQFCAIALPEITNLDDYAFARRNWRKCIAEELFVSGAAQAGLRTIYEFFTDRLNDDVSVRACHVISFGIPTWTKPQKTRVKLLTVQAPSSATMRLFGTCRQYLPTVPHPLTSGDTYWVVSQVLDLVAENLTSRKAWWEGFTKFTADRKRNEYVYSNEREGLSKMINDPTVLPSGPERIFVLACQEALRRHMGRKHGRPGSADWGTEFQKIRIRLARCKNATEFRKTIADFWSRGGSLHQGDDTLLKTGSGWWQEVWPLLQTRDWRKGQDLALVALASYDASPATDAKTEPITRKEMSNHE